MYYRFISITGISGHSMRSHEASQSLSDGTPISSHYR